MENILTDIQGALFHIHSMADLLVGKYQEMVDAKQIDESSKISSPILSIAEIITEKSEYCLEKAEVIESKIRVLSGK